MSELKMQDSSTIEEELAKAEKLLVAIEEGNETYSGPVIQVEDAMTTAAKYLTDKALTALLGQKSKSLIVADENGQPVAKAAYFSVIVRKDQVEKGVKEMANVANDLADKGFIHSILSPISSLSLVRLPMQVESVVVFFFPLVPLDKYEEITQNKYFTLEGGIGPTLDSLEAVLQPGEFMAEVYISEWQHQMIKGNSKETFDVNGQLFYVINEYLSILPKGTRFLGANKCAIVSLGIPYELKFFNTLLKDVKRVELEHVRSCVVTDETKIEQFNLLTGVRYIYRDGTELPVRLDKVTT